MTTEFSEAASKSSETNPLRISNFFHICLGAFNLLAGGLLAFLLSREVEALRGQIIPMVGIAGALLVLGLTQVARAWRDERFRFHPDDIGKFAVAGKVAKSANPDQASYVLDVLNHGVVPEPTPDNALLNKLYSWLPKLELAPLLIRWHAETQSLRIVNLVVTTVGFLLAWIFARAEVFAWLAPVYLLLAIDPVAIWRNLANGAAGAQQLDRPAAPTPHRSVAILLSSVFIPILLGLLPAGALPAAPWATSTIVIPTICAMAVLLVASTLFVFSLKSQTRDLKTSGVGHDVRKDLDIPNIGSGLIDRLESDLPFPRSTLARNAGWQKDGNFGGHLLVEAQQQLNAVRSLGTPLDALRNAWNDPEQKPLVALGAFGVAAGIAATVLAFVATRAGINLTSMLTALSLFAASQFSLLAARGLWNRVDFTSTVYRIYYKGSYDQAQRVAGNSVTGSGTLTENAIRIEHVEFWVAVVRVESVAFSRKGDRFIQSLDRLPDECGVQFSRIADYHGDVMRRKANNYLQEGAVRQIVQGSGSAGQTASGAANALLGILGSQPPAAESAPAQEG